MHRVQYQWQAEAIGYALSLLPGRLHDMAQNCDFFCGDPVFSGVVAESNQNERTTWGCYYDRRWRRGNIERTTIVWPSKDEGALPSKRQDGWIVAGIVHEFAHVIHHDLAFQPRWGIWQLTDYAHTSNNEAFAEHLTARFTSHLEPDAAYMNARRWLRLDQGMTELLDRLSVEP